jgi:glycosyltransferase involved in cell wall biosynthesis
LNKIALCIPAYNAASYLPRLLLSAKNQLIPFDEILVYNDSSTDNTTDVAVKYGATVINGEVNVGCSAGKNALLYRTTCDYIHFHDADDELMPNFTSLAHEWINKPDCPDVVLFDFEWRDNQTNELLGKSNFNDQELRKDPVKYAILNQINPFCGLYKTEKLLTVGGYDIDPAILYNEDVAFHCKLAIAGLTFGAENRVSIINYRIGNSMSASNQLKCAQAHFYVMKLNAAKAGDKYAEDIAYKLWNNAAVLASMSDWTTTKKAVDLAVVLAGKIPRKASALLRSLSILSPYFAVYLREKLIRIFKPGLRAAAAPKK